MTSRQRLYNVFIDHLTAYIQTHGPQTILEIKQLAKDYSVQSMNGVYDLTARRRYCSLFLTYCFQNNVDVPFEGLPAGWGDGTDVCIHDPDNEFTDDINLQKLIKAAKNRNDKKIKNICDSMR
jgi:hypothetical protein